MSLLTVIPLLILLFGVVDRMEQEVRDRTAQELHGSLDKIADELILILKNQKSIAAGLAQVPAVRQFALAIRGHASGEVSNAEYKQRADDLEAFFLNYQLAVNSIQALRFIGPDGKTLVKVKEGKPIEPKLEDPQVPRLFIADQSNKSFFKSAMTSLADVTLSDFELGQVVPGLEFCPSMIRYTIRLKDEVDQPEGFLVVNMWGSRMDATMESSLRGFPRNAYIVELNPDTPRDGIYLYHADTAKRFADQMRSEYRLSAELTPTEWQQVAGAEKTGSIFREDGRMLFYHKIAPFDDRATRWLLVVETESDVIFAPINTMRQSIWWLMAVLLVVSLLLAVWAAYQLTRPVYELADIIRRYADGERGVRYEENRRDEIGQAGRAYNYLTDSLERAKAERDKAEKAARQSERLASVGQMAAGIGHEINNPLMNMMSLASLIEDSLKDNDPELLSDIRLLKKEGKRCATIVQGILSFARETPPEYRQFDMSELIDETLSLLHHRFEMQNIQLKKHIEADLLMYGDDKLLQQVLVNILLNAMQASREGGSILLNAFFTHERQDICIEIRDGGSGIAEEYLCRIFDPFFTTKEEGKGTGLGLSVSYGIVKHHGGAIQLRNNESGNGACVSILLPANKALNDSVVEPMEVANVG
ncbi:MAG: ATP-binding protein [Gammaproteobacteria bacterium]